MSRRQLRVGVVAALAVAGTSLAAPASAAVTVSCTASGQTQFSPGVQVYPQKHQVTYQGDVGNCTDFSGKGITTAKLTASINNVDLSCLASNFGTGSGSGIINWTTNKGTLQSDFDWKLDQAVFNTGRVSGTVKSGLFAGQSFSGEFTTNLLGGAVQCATGPLFGGVKSTTFTGNYQIG